MSATESQEILSEDIVQSASGIQHNESDRVVPVAESIRYRKRAQGAEQKVQQLCEQLSQAQQQAAEQACQINALRLEQQLMHKLASAGAMDLETAVIVAKTKIQGQDSVDLDAVVRQLRQEKQYLFGSTANTVPPVRKTSAVKQRAENSHTILEKAANKAASTGSRRDLQQYLKLRRNYI